MNANNTNSLSLDSPKVQSAIERLSYYSALKELGEDRHLKGKEDQYVNVALAKPGWVLIIRETQVGWWKESYDLRDNEEKNKKMLQKLKDDPEVVYGWFTTHRFTEKGGWDDPNG